MPQISFRSKQEARPFIYHLGARDSLEGFLSDSGKLLLRQSALSIPIPPGIILTKNIAKELNGNKDFLDLFIHNDLPNALYKIDKELKTKLKTKRPGPLFSLCSLKDPQDALSRAYSFEFIGLNEKNITDFEPYCPDGKAIYLNFLRFIKDLSSFIFHVPKRSFQSAFEDIKRSEGAFLDCDITTEGLQEACLFFLHIFKKETGRAFPQTIDEQIELLLKSIYQRYEEAAEDPINMIIGSTKPMEPELLIQGMVFSNLSAYSGQGTLYSRNPANGEAEIYGDYFQKRGSEDIFNEQTAQNTIYANDIRSLQYLMPSIYNELIFFTKKIENDLKATVRIDFTIEDGTLFITNLCKAEEQPLSTLKALSHLVHEGIIDTKTALQQVNPHNVLDAFLQSQTYKSEEGQSHFTFVEAPSTGLCMGKLCFTESLMQECHMLGIPAIYFKESDAECPDIDERALGVIVLRGTKSSSFFQNLRTRNIPSILLGDDVIYNPEAKCLIFPQATLKEGAPIALDANNKTITHIETPFPEISKKNHTLPFFEDLRKIANEFRNVEIVPIGNESSSNEHSSCINLDTMLPELHGSQWSFFLGSEDEKKESFENVRSLLREKLRPLIPKMKMHDFHFLFPTQTLDFSKGDQSLAEYLNDKPKQADRGAQVVQTLIKNHITFEEACPYLLEAITLAIADNLTVNSSSKIVFFLQNIHHKDHLTAIKKRLIEKLKSARSYALINTLEWGITLNPVELPEDFSGLVSETDTLLFDLRNQQKDLPYEILRLAIKEAKAVHPTIEIGLIADCALAIPLASFAERNGLSLLITKPHLIDSCSISAAKEHVF